MSEFYYYVWALYALAGLVFLLLCWRALRRIPLLAGGVCALLGALLFTPTRLVAEKPDLSPAIFQLVLEGFGKNPATAIRNVLAMGVVFVSLMLLMLLGVWLKRTVRAGKSGSPKQVADN